MNVIGCQIVVCAFVFNLGGKILSLGARLLGFRVEQLAEMRLTIVRKAKKCKTIKTTTRLT